MNDIKKRTELRVGCRIETWEIAIFIEENKWKLPVLEDAEWLQRQWNPTEEEAQEAVVLMKSDRSKIWKNSSLQVKEDFGQSSSV